MSVLKKGNLVMRHPHRFLICVFSSKPYPFFWTIIFPDFATFRNYLIFREELYEWLRQRCKKTVNRLLSRTSDDFRYQHQKTLLIFAQNCLLGSSTEFAPELFIEDFDFTRYRNHSCDEIFRILTAFVDKKIKYLLFTEIRRLTGDNTLFHSDVGLAARGSITKVQLSLKRAGYNENNENNERNITKYMFFFKRFKEVRTSELLPSQHPIHEWTLDNYQRVADRYNQRKPEDWESINGEQAEAMLTEIGERIREYERSFIASRTVDIDDPSVRTQLISSENDCSFLLDLCDFIRHLLPTLDGRSDPKINRGINFAILYYNFNLGQREIAARYERNPSNVSRPLNQLYKQIAQRYFESCNTERSSENLARFIQLLTNLEVDRIPLTMPILSRVFVDDFDQIFRAYIVNSHTTIPQMTNFMTSKIEHEYNIQLDDITKTYLSQWIEKQLTHP